MSFPGCPFLPPEWLLQSLVHWGHQLVLSFFQLAPHSRGSDRRESQTHVPHAELAALQAAETGRPFGAAGGPAASSHKERVLHVDVHQLLEKEITQRQREKMETNFTLFCCKTFPSRQCPLFFPLQLRCERCETRSCKRFCIAKVSGLKMHAYILLKFNENV